MNGQRILVVDDEEKIRKAIAAFLERRGASVEQAADGVEAVQLVRERMPDLIVTDVNMPRLNGLELTRRLRQQHRTARLPILMLSARRESTDVLVGYGAGADEYVPKPIELAVLGAKIDTLLRRLRQDSDAAEGPEPGRVVAFVHAKGGVGTTTLVVNAAIALATDRLARVAVLDLNPGLGTAATLLEIQPAHALSELADASGIDDEALGSLVTHHVSGVQFLPTALGPQDAERLTLPLLQRAIDFLRARADVVLIDTPPSFAESVLSVFDSAHEICLVTTPQVPALKATAEWWAVFDRLGVEPARLRLVLNRTTYQGIENRQVSKFLRSDPAAIVPFSESMDHFADAGGAFLSSASQQSGALAIRDLARSFTRHLMEAAPA